MTTARNTAVLMALVALLGAAGLETPTPPAGAGQRTKVRAAGRGKEHTGRKRMDARPDVVLEWTMARTDGGKRLRIDYALHNRTDQRIYACDELIVSDAAGYHRAPEAVIVMNGDRPGLVRFVRGFAASQTPVIVPRYPIARAVNPGGTVKGVAYAPLPLTAWTNYGKMRALEGTPTSAVLDVQYVVGQARWGSVTLADGTKVTVAQPAAPLRYATTEPKPLPG